MMKTQTVYIEHLASVQTVSEWLNALAGQANGIYRIGRVIHFQVIRQDAWYNVIALVELEAA